MIRIKKLAGNKKFCYLFIIFFTLIKSQNKLQEDLKSVKTFFTPGMLFECFGFRYFGPVDGHNLDELLETLNYVQLINCNLSNLP